MNACRFRADWVAAAAACFVVLSCTPQRTTRMTADDLDVMSQALANSLAASEAVVNRTPDSPLWVITINKVQNLSSDVMTESEQWSVMARIRSSLPIQELWRQKNIRFVIPAQRLHALQNSSQSPSTATAGSRRQPTHEMSATFRSVTRAQARKRTDLYYCEFHLVGLNTSERVWSDKFEYKRAAAGHVWD